VIEAYLGREMADEDIRQVIRAWLEFKKKLNLV
jgi:hypothetical protein